MPGFWSIFRGYAFLGVVMWTCTVTIGAITGDYTGHPQPIWVTLLLQATTTVTLLVLLSAVTWWVARRRRLNRLYEDILRPVQDRPTHIDGTVHLTEGRTVPVVFSLVGDDGELYYYRCILDGYTHADIVDFTATEKPPAGTVLQLGGVV